MSYLSRVFVRFQNNPSSVRYAAAAIVSTFIFLVVVGALLMRVFDPDSYPNFGEALWFTLQTVTTVGYGDDTPDSGPGRVLAGIVMLVSIALITVITAGITSMFIRSISRERDEANHLDMTETLARIEASLAKAHERLDRIEHSTDSGATNATTGT